MTLATLSPSAAEVNIVSILFLDANLNFFLVIWFYICLVIFERSNDVYAQRYKRPKLTYLFVEVNLVCNANNRTRFASVSQLFVPFTQIRISNFARNIENLPCQLWEKSAKTCHRIQTHKNAAIGLEIVWRVHWRKLFLSGSVPEICVIFVWKALCSYCNGLSHAILRTNFNSFTLNFGIVAIQSQRIRG